MTGKPASDGDFVKHVETVLLDRMDRLERENRRLRRYGNLTMIGMAVTLGLTAAVFWFSGRFGIVGGVPENIVARQFSLRDAGGANRGTWSVAEDGTARLVLADARGRPRVRLSLLPDGAAGLSFGDSTDHKLLVLGSLADQSSSFVMSDAQGTARSVLGVSPGGAANLVFADQNGATKAGLGVDARGLGTFTLADRGGRQVEEAPADADTVDEPADSQPPPPARPAARKK
ncbi:MAG TPA: hypothetical protein VHR43_17830 [Gemmatimonadales bacterium]|nr:hypothetical protein [Gemmatimonadales bacterium]